MSVISVHRINQHKKCETDFLFRTFFVCEFAGNILLRELCFFGTLLFLEEKILFRLKKVSCRAKYDIT